MFHKIYLINNNNNILYCRQQTNMNYFPIFTIVALIVGVSSTQAETIRNQAKRLRSPAANSAANVETEAFDDYFDDGSALELIDDESNHLNYIIDAFATLDALSMPFVGTDPDPSTSSNAIITTSTPTTSSAPTLPPALLDEDLTQSPNDSLAPTMAPNGESVVPTSSAPTIPFGPLGNTLSPTVSGVCPGITDGERDAQILAILDAAADPAAIRDDSTPQSQATAWILLQDQFLICPDNAKLLQRWAAAVIYYSTGGDDWFLCSADATDDCGAENPFADGELNFLSAVTECDWAGISCNNGCITEIEFEENNLIGTIPTEIALLTDLTIWGMERGELTGTIPTEVGLLTNLIFIDLDFNQLTGTLSSELLSLSSLTQLDLNNNQFSGSINDIGVFPDMEFLQLHDNSFTGTVPEAVGSFANLSAFTMHESFISGTMPASVCDLLATNSNGNGVLTSLIADCANPNASVECDCCTDCR